MMPGVARGTGGAVHVLVIAVYAVALLTALLAAYYALRDLAADFVLLGACALLLLVWIVESALLGLHDATGGAVDDPVTLYGYLLTGAALPLGGIWLGVGERTRWGSVAILVVALTVAVLQMRLPQIWAGGFT